MAPDDLFVRCRRCGAKNRIPRARLHEGPRCGKCRHPLSADTPVNVTDQTFQAEVLSHAGPVLVDCWAPWCGPCRQVAPVLDELAREYAGRLKVAKLNVDENPHTASRYAIRSIPTLLVFEGGRLRSTLVGALPKETLISRLGQVLQGA